VESGSASMEVLLEASAEIFLYMQDMSDPDEGIEKDGLFLCTGVDPIPDDDDDGDTPPAPFHGTASLDGCTQIRAGRKVTDFPPVLELSGMDPADRRLGRCGEVLQHIPHRLQISPSDSRPCKMDDDLNWFEEFSGECIIKLLSQLDGVTPKRVANLMGRRPAQQPSDAVPCDDQKMTGESAIAQPPADVAAVVADPIVTLQPRMQATKSVRASSRRPASLGARQHCHQQAHIFRPVFQSQRRSRRTGGSVGCQTRCWSRPPVMGPRGMASSQRSDWRGSADLICAM